MLCGCGEEHTVCLDDNGIAYSFGHNSYGQLGHDEMSLIPQAILNLPKIKQISCGGYFTVLVDEEGIIWAFGSNNSGQLGIGNKTDSDIPQKMQNIPPVQSISCGFEHVLIITYEETLWSVGNNEFWQLCLDNDENQIFPQQTEFTNIIKVSSGSFHSLFQNSKGEIYGCGNNRNGQLGLGKYNNYQSPPCLIPKAPADIIEFLCGFGFSLFLDKTGRVFSVGHNGHGNLGLGHLEDKNTLTQIPNIPPIKIISCIGNSSYLIDVIGNVWSFGHNNHFQLGLDGVTQNIRVPTKINCLKDIQQISYGCCGYHFLCKDFLKIFVVGRNDTGQLGLGNTSESFFCEMDSTYFPIWGGIKSLIYVKSARK